MLGALWSLLLSSLQVGPQGEGSGCLRSDPLLTLPRVRDLVLHERDGVVLCRSFFFFLR